MLTELPNPLGKQRPRISVITVCYNARALIRGTILSVRNQTYSDVELIVIDGASTDGTREVLHSESDDIDVLVSEPDRGIYDAMNKGLALATGTWVIFINAGDSFASADVLQQVVPTLSPARAIVYGGVRIVGANPCAPVTFQQLVRWHVVKNICHQAIFYNRVKLGDMLTFHTEYRVCADFELLVRILTRFGPEAALPVNVPVANYLSGGMSDRNGRTRIEERLAILSKSRLPFLTKFLSLCNAYRHLFLST